MGKQVAITDSFLNSVFKLNNQDRKLAFNTARQISENPTAASLHMHAINREKCDKKFQSARVNLDLRLILVKREDVCTLLYVDHHDAAYDWCEGKYLVKTNFGSEYIYDEKLAEGKLDEFANLPHVPEYLSFGQTNSLYENAKIKKKNLEKLGIQEIHAENLMKIENEEQLLEYIEFFPEELQEALIDLATGAKTFDTVYNSLYAENSEEVQKHEIQRFYLTEDMDELEKLMDNEDFERWTLFLHPSQERLVNLNCNGPMLIEGGPGTGKTIVGVHRAVKLAKDTFKSEDDKKILFCTFSKKLANNISKKIQRLCDIKGVENNIDCISVDSYIAKMLGHQALNINTEEILNILKSVYASGMWKYSREFFTQEYYEVIEKYHICSREEYINAQRTGGGIALSKAVREEVWPYFEKVLREKKSKNAYSYVDRAFQLDALIRKNKISKKYNSVIIDEAQDLESIKLAVIANSVIDKQNNVCILSDRNQRIFRLNTWSQDTGIKIVGRTYYLRINYRTTKQINEYARSQFMEFDLSCQADKEYISIMSGEDPEIISCSSEGEENHVIVDKVNNLLALYNPEEICVLAPTYAKLNSIKAICEYEGIKTETLMSSEDENPDAVKLCTTSGVKGLEFSAVIISSFNYIGTQRENYGSAPEAIINYEKLVECEKYVSITRARDKVVITYLGE